MVDFIPDYIPPHRLVPKRQYGLYEKSFRTGVAMDLKKSANCDDYLAEVLGKNSLKYLKRSINRLNRDCQIRLVPYYGYIETDMYHSLLEELKNFILSRFNQKNQYHLALGRWEYYTTSLYDLILQKKASLFVLYDSDKPISISLNYHYNEKVLDLAINSYDIYYEKYSLGKQMIVKQMQWAYENGYELIDLRWGDFKYKLDFSNKKTKYKTHVFFSKKNIVSRIMAWCTILGFHYKQHLYNNFFLKKVSPKFKNRLLHKPNR